MTFAQAWCLADVSIPDMVVWLAGDFLCRDSPSNDGNLEIPHVQIAHPVISMGSNVCRPLCEMSITLVQSEPKLEYSNMV